MTDKLQNFEPDQALVAKIKAYLHSPEGQELIRRVIQKDGPLKGLIPPSEDAPGPNLALVGKLPERKAPD